jgi:plastocyanin
MEPRRLQSLARDLSHGLSRRALMRGALGSGGTTLVAAGLAQATDDPAIPFDQGEAQLREFDLTASEFDWAISADTMVRAWGYNGQIPGPELRVREGDQVRVTLRNDLPVPTTIHWHGVNVPPAMDGPAGLNQAAVAPGDEFVYAFTARPNGTRWYHSHTDPALQIALGLYGPFIIEPRQPLRTFDREYTYILQEWDLELTPDVALGKTPPGPGDRLLRGGELGSDLFLFNGHAHDGVTPIRLTTGDRVLIRLINAGNMPHAIHTHGHSFKIVATDGNPVPLGMEWVKDSLLIGPSERYDLELVGDNPGVWMFHCHMEHHMANGMMTLIVYDGYRPTGPTASIFDPQTGTIRSSHEHATQTETPPSSAPATPTPAALTPTPASAAPATVPAESSPPAHEPNVVEQGHAVEIAMLDDRFEPTTLTVPAGTRVTWVNKGRDWHSVAAFDGSFESGRVAPGDTFAVRLDQPGDYQYLCKHHVMQGMIGKITVT